MYLFELWGKAFGLGDLVGVAASGVLVARRRVNECTASSLSNLSKHTHMALALLRFFHNFVQTCTFHKSSRFQVRVGDTIMSINGKECANQSVDQTRFQLNGVPGTAVPPCPPVKR